MSLFQLHEYIQLVLGFFNWSLLGQGALHLLAGANRRQNIFYRTFMLLNFPVFWVARLVLPSSMAAARVGLLAFVFVLVLRVVMYMLFFRLGAIPTITPVGN